MLVANGDKSCGSENFSDTDNQTRNLEVKMVNDETYKHPGWKIKFCTEIILCILFLLFSIAMAEAIIYVKPGGNDANSGLSWAQAKKMITGALSVVATGDEVWVAAGTYVEHIQISKTMALYGGFKGDETARDQRDWIKNITVLDGGGGAPSLSGTVIEISSNLGPSTRVDGFTITGGHGINGGGIQIVGSAPVIANNIIKKNKTDGYGAGISILYFNPTSPPEFPLITDNTIIENSSVNDEGDGGGIAVVESSPTIRRNVIARNEATRNGGGIACWRNNSPIIENNFILENSASVPPSDTKDFGTINVGGGGIFASATDLNGTPIEDAVSAPVIINNVVAANGAYTGGGICVVDSIRTDLGVATITNNTVVANNGTGIFWVNTSPTINNNLVAFNTWGLEQGTYGITSSTIRYNNIFGNVLKGEKTDYEVLIDQTGLNGNISADPKMANYKIGDFHLQPDSPCVNKGTMDAIDLGWTDMDGQDRVIGSKVDIGADESDGTVWNSTPTIYHVKPDGNDALDGLTWMTAKKTVTSAIETAALTGGEVWVAKGTYTEHITIPAFVYLYGGFSGTEIDRGSRNISANPTILDGGGIPTVVKSINAGYLVSSLDGFTVQNGGIYTGGVPGSGSTGLEGLGGGIYCRVSSPYIANDVIKNNSLGRYNAPYFAKGGGIGLYLSYTVINGNTIRNNEVLATGDGMGGGIYISSSMPDIEGNTISQNHAKYGAAIFSTGSSGSSPLTQRSSPLIRHNLVENNAMYYVPLQYGGSVFGAITIFEDLDFVIEGNLIKGNTAQEGAGIIVQATFAGSILNNIITGNTAVDVSTGLGGMGGGLYCEIAQNPTSNINIVNNTITYNKASGGVFGEMGGGIAVTLLSDKVVIANNLIAFNSSGIYRDPYHSLVAVPHLVSNNDFFTTGSNYINLPSGINDLSVDPDFVNKDGGDFHLKSTSLCIDAGNNSAVPASLITDFEGNARIIDGNGDGIAVVDIGAYEFLKIPAGILGDVNNDGKIDISDVILDLRIALKLDSVKPCSDINKDGLVDISDVILTLRMALGLDELKQCTG